MDVVEMTGAMPLVGVMTSISGTYSISLAGLMDVVDSTEAIPLVGVMTSISMMALINLVGLIDVVDPTEAMAVMASTSAMHVVVVMKSFKMLLNSDTQLTDPTARMELNDVFDLILRNSTSLTTPRVAFPRSNPVSWSKQVGATAL